MVNAHDSFQWLHLGFGSVSLRSGSRDVLNTSICSPQEWTKLAETSLLQGWRDGPTPELLMSFRSHVLTTAYAQSLLTHSPEFVN